MPRKTQRARERGVPRCCYVENGQKCVRNGSGNPPLCRAHHLVLEDMYTRSTAAGGRVGQVLGDFLAGRAIDPQAAVAALGELFGFGRPPHPAGDPGMGGGPRMPAGSPWQVHPPRQPPRPAVDPEVLERRRALAMARQELGFQAQEPLTREAVERRRKEMARRHHPDLGGSVERMARINQAADLLLETGNLG